MGLLWYALFGVLRIGTAIAVAILMIAIAMIAVAILLLRPSM